MSNDPNHQQPTYELGGEGLEGFLQRVSSGAAQTNTPTREDAPVSTQSIVTEVIVNPEAAEVDRLAQGLAQYASDIDAITALTVNRSVDDRLGRRAA